MFKKFSVLILAVIQVVFCISLPAIEPGTEWVVEKFGTDYYLKIASIHYSDDIGYIVFNFRLYCDWQNSQDDLYCDIFEDQYGIIKTDEKGVSRLSDFTFSRPEKEEYIKGHFETAHCSYFTETVPSDETAEALVSLGIPLRNNYYHIIPEYEGNHDLALKVRVYNGLFSIDGITVNGAAIEELIQK